MKFSSLLASCSSADCTNTADECAFSITKYRRDPPSLPKQLCVSDSSFSGSEIPSTSSSASTSCGSLYSNSSIETLPSVPSLQKLTPDKLNLLVTQLPLIAFKPRPLLPITCLAFHVDEGLLYCASSHEIFVLDKATFTNLDSFQGNDSSSGSIKAFAFNNGRIFTAHQDSKIRVWQKSSKRHHSMLTALPTIHDRLLRSVLPSNYVTVRRHKKQLWIEHADAVTDLAVCNGTIYSVSWDKCLKIWRSSDFRCVESVQAHEDAINAVVVSHDGTVYTGSADKRVRVWAKPLGEKRHVLIATLEKHKSAVNALALNEDGSVLFSGACDRSILVWEREDSAHHMAVTGALRGHGKAILCLINVSDLLLSGSADRTVRIWKRGFEGKYSCLAVLDGHQKPVKSLTAVVETEPPANGAITVYSGSLDGEIKVWQVSVTNADDLVSPA